MPAPRIIIVDDDDDHRRWIEWQLGTFSFEVELVAVLTSGQEAIDLLADQPVDLAIVDYRMPTMNGVELAERLKAINSGCEVLILTAYDDARDTIASSPYVDSYLAKMEIEKLEETIKAMGAGVG